MTEETSMKRKSISEDETLAKKAKLDTVAADGSAESFHSSDNLSDNTSASASNGESKNDPKDEESTKETSESRIEDASAKPAPVVTSKPVFGAASAFGSASIFENMKNKTNVFDSLPSKSDEKPKEAPSVPAASSFGSFGGSFGADSNFSNALHKASQKKSFLDEPKDEAASENSEPAPLVSQQYKQVELTEQKVETGEENEKSIFSNIAKLFELDLSNIAEGWKERGRGQIHLNRSLKNASEARLVMRSNGLLRVILNYKITPTTTLIKGLEASMSPGKFLRITSVSAEGKPIQYMLRFPNEEVRNELYESVEELKKDLAKVSSAKKNEPVENSKPQATGFRFIPDPYEKDSKDGNSDK